ncbi:MAG: flagellar basal body L-ring protein FlgH [Deltaproteobacteria bacterium]|nr:flagellar basal body L-ring protein FlgH [Deltaproteobacteria bacterium]
MRQITNYKLQISKFLCLFLLTVFAGCATAKLEKVDTSTIQMPKAVTAEHTAGSLWPGETTKNSFFQDTRARNVGDIVVVSIVEKASATKEATTDTSRDGNIAAGVTDFLGMPLSLGKVWSFGSGTNKAEGAFNPSAAGSMSNSFKGEGTTTRTDQILGTIAARVTEVLPNGNLVIEGKKETVLNSERQYIILSGIIRPEDVTAANTISSNYIADARISYSGDGVLAEKQNPGWLTRVFDVVWPF